jgi:hypothetical protein
MVNRSESLIVQHIDQARLQVTRVAEESERQILERITATAGGAA